MENNCFNCGYQKTEGGAGCPDDRFDDCHPGDNPEDWYRNWIYVEDAPEQPLVCTDRNNPPKLPEGRVDAAGDVLDAMIEHINDGIKYFSRVRDGSMTPGLVSAMAAEAVVRLGKIRRLIHPATGEPKKPTAGEELVDTVKNIRVAGDRLKAAFEAYLGEDNG